MSCDSYIENHCTPRPAVLEWLRRQTNLRTNHARMLSGEPQGALLTMLVQVTGARKVLELGTFTGYASICLALGLPEGGHLDTLEHNDELVDLIQEGFSRAGVANLITLHTGEALDILATFAASATAAESYDLAYIDANKREYCAYFEAVLPLLRHGGLILADNTLWDGKILEDPLPVDAQTQEIARFNDMVAKDPRVEMFILPLRDGLSFIRKK